MFEEESNKVTKDNETDHIIDARYQSYSRVYIHDIHEAEIIDDENGRDDQSIGSKKGIIRIKNTLLSKVCICGMIVNIYEANKYFRLKVDDSTGCINVTLWKSLIFNDQSLDHLHSSNSYENSENRSSFSKLYSLLDAIQTRIKDESVNNRILYEPKQGDLVVIRAQIKCFRQKIELNAITCSRIQNSKNEMVQIVLPSILSNKIYSKEAITLDMYNEMKNFKTEPQTNFLSNAVHTETEVVDPKEKENFINLVSKKLVQLTSNTDSTLNSQPCNSYSLYNFLKNNCPTEFKKFLTTKQVLDALKELETRGLAYSCDDEFHYLPAN
jgi:hypothetical protein